MTDITYQTGTSNIAAHGTNYLDTFTTWCCQLAEVRADRRPLSRAVAAVRPRSRDPRSAPTDDYSRGLGRPLRFQPDFC
ncbi:MAG TPA: hypothetical protein VKD19_10655 [Pseudolabrys sp.]|nr:hypothetical protein [Pseudolabrys sp.]